MAINVFLQYTHFFFWIDFKYCTRLSFEMRKKEKMVFFFLFHPCLIVLLWHKIFGHNIFLRKIRHLEHRIERNQKQIIITNLAIINYYENQKLKTNLFNIFDLNRHSFLS